MIDAAKVGDEFRFLHPVGTALTAPFQDAPEWAIAHPEERVLEACVERGLGTRGPVRYGGWSGREAEPELAGHPRGGTRRVALDTAFSRSKSRLQSGRRSRGAAAGQGVAGDEPPSLRERAPDETAKRPRADAGPRAVQVCAITSTTVMTASATPPTVNSPTVRNRSGTWPPVCSACSNSRWRCAPTSHSPTARDA